MAGLLFVISAPSGTGKSTLCRELMKALPEMFYSVSMTTRSPRKGERDGQDYHFVDRATFDQVLAKNGFMEYAEVFDNYYGSPKGAIDKALGSGKDVLMDVDVQGAMEIFEANKDAISIFLLPPSMEVLEQRLMQRKTDTEAQIKNRITTARKEIGYVHHYSYVICNDDLAESIRALKAVVRAERCRTPRNRQPLAKLGFKI